MDQPFFNDNCKLQKFSGKGAWTFVKLPSDPSLPKKKNNTVRVRGFIDDYELKAFNMWTMKDGNFIAVKAEIRKKIKKEEGDTVKLTLYLDELGVVAQDDFIICLREEPKLFKHFEKYPAKRKKEITDWIFAAKTEEDKIVRIGQALEKIESEIGL